MKEEKGWKEEIEIPEGINLELKGKEVSIKGEKGECTRLFSSKRISLSKKENLLIMTAKKSGKKVKKEINTAVAHIKNMIKGVQEGFTYKLKVCSGHFPITVSVSNDELQVKNYFGEKTPRLLKLKKGPEVKIEGDMITVSGIDKEICGQVAADIERTCSRKNFDRRIFQDGIYIIEKDGKPIR